MWHEQDFFLQAIYSKMFVKVSICITIYYSQIYTECLYFGCFNFYQLIETKEYAKKLKQVKQGSQIIFCKIYWDKSLLWIFDVGSMCSFIIICSRVSRNDIMRPLLYMSIKLRYLRERDRPYNI